MSKQVIFIVHGVGDQKANWSKPAVKALRDWYKKFKLPSSFDERYHIIEILYGDPFINYWKSTTKRSAHSKN